MAVHLAPIGNGFQFFDVNGKPLNSGQLVTYAAGTVSAEPTFSTMAGTVSNANPIVLGVDGRVPAEIWFSQNTAYKVQLLDSLSNIIATYDNLSGINDVISSDIDFIAAGSGAVTRTVESKLRDIVSVADFGTVGNGVTDDTTAIQNAIDAVGGRGGGVVYFPPGVYAITSLSITTPYTTLKGTGKFSSVLRITSGTTTGVLVTGTSLAMCGIEDLGFDQSVDCTDNTKAMLRTSGVFRFYVRNCFFNGYLGATTGAHTLMWLCGNSITVDHTDGTGGKTSGWYISNINTVSQLGVGAVFGPDGTGGYFINNSIVNSARVTGYPLCVYAVPGGDVHISDSDFIAGLKCLISGVNFGIISKLFSDSSQSGFAISGCEFLTFNGCQFANRVSGGAGDGVGVVIGNSKNLTFQGCHAINCGTDGVQIANDTDTITWIGGSVVDNNITVTSAAHNGFTIAANTNGFKIIGVTIGNGSVLLNGGQKYGIAIGAGTSDNYIITHNDVRNNDTAGILDGGTGTNKWVKENIGGVTDVSTTDVFTNPLGGDVALNSTANYFNGPVIAQGTTGKWFAFGTVTILDTAGSAQFNAKLWDGTTVIASAGATSPLANFPTTISLGGYINAPVGNLRIDVKDITSTNGVLKFNASGNSKDSIISAVRIG
jgi:hypothetical protein